MSLLFIYRIRRIIIIVYNCLFLLRRRTVIIFSSCKSAFDIFINCQVSSNQCVIEIGVNSFRKFTFLASSLGEAYLNAQNVHKKFQPQENWVSFPWKAWIYFNYHREKNSLRKKNHCKNYDIEENVCHLVKHSSFFHLMQLLWRSSEKTQKNI